MGTYKTSFRVQKRQNTDILADEHHFTSKVWLLIHYVASSLSVLNTDFICVSDLWKAQTGDDMCCILHYLSEHHTQRGALLPQCRETPGHQDAASMPHSQRTSGGHWEKYKKKDMLYLCSPKPAAVHIQGLALSNPLLDAGVGKFAHWQPQMAARAKWGRTFQFMLSGNATLSLRAESGVMKKVHLVYISLNGPLTLCFLRTTATQFSSYLHNKVKAAGFSGTGHLLCCTQPILRFELTGHLFYQRHCNPSSLQKYHTMASSPVL